MRFVLAAWGTSPGTCWETDLTTCFCWDGGNGYKPLPMKSVERFAILGKMGFVKISEEEINILSVLISVGCLTSVRQISSNITPLVSLSVMVAWHRR